MNEIENKFIADYIKKDGFWYTFKRTAAELDKIYAHFNLFKSFEIFYKDLNSLYESGNDI